MENDNFVMMDTCTISQIFDINKINNQDKIKTHNIEVLKELFNTNKCPVITDLSFVEIICGLNKDNFYYILDTLEKCEFLILSTNSKFKKYVEYIKENKANYDKIERIKDSLLKVKVEVLFPFFMNLFERYMKMLILILSQKNSLFFNFYLIVNNPNFKFKDLIEHYLNNLLEDAIINHNKLDLFKTVHDLILKFFSYTYSNPIHDEINDVNVMDVDKIINEIDEIFKKSESKIPSISKKILIEIKRNKVISHDNIDKTLEYMLSNEYIRKNNNKLDNYVQERVIDYINGSYFFDGVKFKINDLVDAYNCIEAFNDQYKISYYTSDDRWKKFLKYNNIINEKNMPNY